MLLKFRGPAQVEKANRDRAASGSVVTMGVRIRGLDKKQN
jgi:hypothetical protein